MNEYLLCGKMVAYIMLEMVFCDGTPRVCLIMVSLDCHITLGNCNRSIPTIVFIKGQVK